MERLGKFVIVCAAASSIFGGCAPSKAMAVRQQKPVTVGFVGAAYRPTGMTDIGVEFGLDNTLDTSVTRTGADGSKLPEKRDVSVTTRSGALYVHRYIWDTSAFYWGLGVGRAESLSRFSESKTGSTSAAPLFTPVAYETSATYINAPIGWNWIWENGFTLKLDTGPRFAVAKASKFRNDGGTEVNEEERRITTSALDKTYNPSLYLLVSQLMVGYSF